MIKQNFYIHVGMHKCASSFLQRYFFEKIGIQLKDFKIITRKEETKKIIKIIHELSEKNISIGNARKSLHKFVGNYQNVIISHESLMGYHFFEFNDAKKKFYSMEKLFLKPNYLIMYRIQSEFLYSLWLHRIRKGNKVNFYDFVNSKIKNKKNLNPRRYLTNFKKYNYNKIFSAYLGLNNKRIVFINISEIKNKNIFIRKIEKFLEIKNKIKEINLKKKINISRQYELAYLYMYKNFRLTNRLVLFILTLIYKSLRPFVNFKNLNYKFSHFNTISFLYLNIVTFLLENSFIGKKYLLDIDKAKNLINIYYKKSNNTFLKKIKNK